MEAGEGNRSVGRRGKYDGWDAPGDVICMLGYCVGLLLGLTGGHG